MGPEEVEGDVEWRQNAENRETLGPTEEDNSEDKSAEQR